MGNSKFCHYRCNRIVRNDTYAHKFTITQPLSQIQPPPSAQTMYTPNKTNTNAKVVECSCLFGTNIDAIFRAYLSLAKVSINKPSPAPDNRLTSHKPIASSLHSSINSAPKTSASSTSSADQTEAERLVELSS